MAIPIDNTQWRRQWVHSRQFEHRLEDLRKLGFRVTDDQLRSFYNVDGFGFIVQPLDDPSLEMEAPIVDVHGRSIMIPTPMEFTAGHTNVYADLDHNYGDWRSWPGFTGYVEPVSGCFDWNCYMCSYYYEPQVYCAPVWEAFIVPDPEVAGEVVDAVRRQLVAAGYPAWYHYWVAQMYGEDDDPVPEPTQELILHQIRMPTKDLQDTWDELVEALEHNWQLCRQIESAEYRERLESDRRIEEMRNRKSG